MERILPAFDNEPCEGTNSPPNLGFTVGQGAHNLGVSMKLVGVAPKPKNMMKEQCAPLVFFIRRMIYKPLFNAFLSFFGRQVVGCFETELRGWGFVRCWR
jgi:hypothetical protein